jgi:hypothetical protein
MADEYRDITPGADVVIFPAKPEGFHGAISPNGVEHIWSTLRTRLRAAGWDCGDLDRLERVHVSAEPGPSVATRASGNAIVVSDGHLRAGAVFAYAAARLEGDLRINDCYTLWFEYLTDALVQGDPIIHLDANFAEIQAEAMSNPPNLSLTAKLFSEINYGWVALLLAHEAAHILLEHVQKFSRHFPNISDNPNSWSAPAKALSREFELEADAKALDMLLDAKYLSIRAISVWFQWQCVRSVVIATLAGGNWDPESTHPSHIERCRRFVKGWAERNHEPASVVDKVVSATFELTSKYDKALRAGNIQKLFPMRGRPVSMQVAEERARKRRMQIDQCLQRAAG